MRFHADTAPPDGDAARLSPESESRTDLHGRRIWTSLAASRESIFLSTSTAPYRDAKPSVEFATVNPREISVTATTSHLLSSVEDKPFYLTLWSAPSQINRDKVSWTSRAIPRPEKLWAYSQPINATEQTEDTVSDAVLRSIVLSARGIRFEDGIENDFSRRLVDFVSTYRGRAVSSLNKAILDTKIAPDIVAEALIWIARIKDASTYGARLRLLINALLSPSPQIRDGASLGLALLDDRSAIPWARLAVRLEWNKELKNDMAKVLSQLESQT